MRRSPLTRQLALALAALLVTSCLTVQTRQRPITDVGGGADGHGGITLKVFADDDALKAGTLITTGSLCGLVPTNGPGKGVARMGGHTVEVQLT